MGRRAPLVASLPDICNYYISLGGPEGSSSTYLPEQLQLGCRCFGVSIIYSTAACQIPRVQPIYSADRTWKYPSHNKQSRDVYQTKFKSKLNSHSKQISREYHVHDPLGVFNAEFYFLQLHHPVCLYLPGQDSPRSNSERSLYKLHYAVPPRIPQGMCPLPRAENQGTSSDWYQVYLD